MDLTKQYLYCYTKLYDPQQSKHANRRLLQIQESYEAWTLSQDLINHQNQQNAIHGFQLLSQKLNKPPPKEISMAGIISFIYEKPIKKSIHWVCIAKAIIQMSPKEPLNSITLQKDDMIKLMKEIPSVISQIRTNPPLDAMQLKKKYFEKLLPSLIDDFDSNPLEILQCISIFLQQGIKLNNSQMMKKILNKQIEVVGSIVHDILQKEIYQHLQKQIIDFFDRNRSNRILTSIVMAFYRNVNLKTIAVQRFTYEIQYILACLLAQKQIKQNYLLCNSYEFWEEIFKKIQQNNLQPQKNNVILSAICSLWNIVCASCRFQQLPQKLNCIKSSLSLDVDEIDENEQINSTSLQVNNKANKFRDYGQDFLNMCLKYIKNQPQILHFIFNYVQQLTRGSLIQLQLSIFIIINILQTNDTLIQYTKNAVKRIFTRKQQYNEYLCSRVINLIGKIQKLINIDLSILPEGLSFLLACINYESLSNAASQNCCELLDSLIQFNESSNSQNLELFINNLYNILFTSIQISEKVCQNLTKSITIYIYKFKKDVNTYAKYLQYYSSQISNFDYTKRKKYLQALIIAQYWLNIKDQRKYLMTFSIFLDQQIPFLTSLISNSTNKQQFSQSIYMINISIKTNAILIIEKWLQMIDQIFMKYVYQSPVHTIFTPFKNLMNAAIYLESTDIMDKVFTFSLKWIEPITLILLNQQKHQFSMTSIIIEIHLILIKTYKINQSIPSLQQTAIFSIKNMINFLINYIHSTEIFQFQVFKFSLQYYMIALQLGINPEPIVSNIFCNYKKLADTLWKYIETIIFYTYKKYGSRYILSGLKDAKSTLDQQNPLTSVLIQNLQKNQGKAVKNILLSLC